MTPPREEPDPELPHTSPLDRILRRESPYDGMFKHAAKVAECVRLLKEGYAQYADGDFDTFSETTKRIGRLEHEADVIKSSVRAHLPRSLFMSVGRREFELLLHDQDKVLDSVEDLAERMDARPTNIPEALRPGFERLVGAAITTVDTYEKAMETFSDVLATGFGGSARDEVKELIKEVHAREFEGDRERFALLREIYARENEMKPLDVVHLVLYADLLDDVADAAEAAADRLRALVAQ